MLHDFRNDSSIIVDITSPNTNYSLHGFERKLEQGFLDLGVCFPYHAYLIIFVNDSPHKCKNCRGQVIFFSKTLNVYTRTFKSSEIAINTANARRNMTKSDFDLTATTAQMYIVVLLVNFPRGLRKYLVSSEL